MLNRITLALREWDSDNVDDEIVDAILGRQAKVDELPEGTLRAYCTNVQVTDHSKKEYAKLTGDEETWVALDEIHVELDARELAELTDGFERLTGLCDSLSLKIGKQKSI